MAAGLPSGQADLNRVLGNAVVTLAQALDNVVGLNGMLLDPSRVGAHAGLVALGFTDDVIVGGVTTPGEATLILNSFGDLSNLAAVAHGQRTQPGASDFFFSAKQLMGIVPL